MPRAPCCEKMGLKKGPWTREEDQLLINYVHNYGHTNWRALPKHAGLLRCGKSCRLRWINYLRPDIKRGNFSPQEEDTIINLHQLLGNRWSAIAARLPGRTDNEIKNVWHTHLKKKLHKNQKQTTPEDDTTTPICVPICSDNTGSSSNATNMTQSSAEYSSSSEYSSSLATSSSSEATTDNICVTKDESCTGVLGYFPEIDDSFWVDALSDHNVEGDHQVGLFEDDEMDFWYNVFASSEDLQLPEC